MANPLADNVPKKTPTGPPERRLAMTHTPHTQPDTPKPRPTRNSEGSIKETIESIIVAFVLAFVFRAFVVEAFVIPTGSMAPTLLGQHVSFTCPQCGHHFDTDTRDKGSAGGRPTSMPLQGVWSMAQPAIRSEHPLEVPCPMCDYRIVERTLHTKPGDRILVLKYVYALGEPRRWDVVVFRNPESPAENYIKRLIGLDNEWLWIGRGNIYTSKDQGRTWAAQVKPAKVQREVWQPIYHSRYVPLDAQQRPWQTPWRQSEGIRAIDHGLSFAYQGQREASLDFAFGRYEPQHSIEAYPLSRDFYPYNAFSYQQGLRTEAFSEDLRLAATVEPERPGLGATLELATDALEIRGVVGADGQRRIDIRPAGIDNAAWHTVGPVVAGEPLSSDRPTRLELWHVDHTVQLWVDGARVVMHRIPLTVSYRPDAPRGPHVRIGPEAVGLSSDEIGEEAMRVLDLRGAPRRMPAARLTLRGPRAAVRDVDLDRDLYYTDEPGSGTRGPVPLTGTRSNIAKLGEDQFFCLGDNSPQSKDSRRWEDVDDWVTYHTADPTGPHGEHGVPPGFVPRKLLIGRAFFVYFPAPYSFTATSYPIIPNFSDLRFIR